MIISTTNPKVGARGRQALTSLRRSAEKRNAKNQTKLRRDESVWVRFSDPRMNRQRIAWFMWAIGSVLIALSWFSVVSTTIGWIGFGVGMAGSMIGWGLKPPPSEPTPKEPDDPTDDSAPDQ